MGAGAAHHRRRDKRPVHMGNVYQRSSADGSAGHSFAHSADPADRNGTEKSKTDRLISKISAPPAGAGTRNIDKAGRSRHQDQRQGRQKPALFFTPHFFMRAQDGPFL